MNDDDGCIKVREIGLKINGIEMALKMKFTSKDLYSQDAEDKPKYETHQQHISNTWNGFQ